MTLIMMLVMACVRVIINLHSKNFTYDKQSKSYCQAFFCGAASSTAACLALPHGINASSNPLNRVLPGKPEDNIANLLVFKTGLCFKPRNINSLGGSLQDTQNLLRS